MSEGTAYEGPAIVELMGHRRLAGHVTEAQMYGTTLLRVDVPQGDGSTATQFYGGSSIYALTPTTEAMVERIAATNSVRPVERWELPSADADDPDDREGYQF